jgi:CHAT domain-containing protein
LAALDRAEAVSRQNQTFEREATHLDEARRFLRGSDCLEDALIFAEQTVATLYANLNDLSTAVEHLEASCSFYARIDPGIRLWQMEFDCYGQLLIINIELDRFEKAKRLVGHLQQLMEGHHVETVALVSQLANLDLEAATSGKTSQQAAYADAEDALATGVERTLREMRKHAQTARNDLFLGDYRHALGEATEAHRLLEREPDAKLSPLALLVLQVRGTVHLYLEEPAKALEAFEEGDALLPGIRTRVAGDAKALKLIEFTVASFYSKMVTAQLLTAENDRAQATLRKATAAAQASGFDGLAKFLGLDRLDAQLAIQKAGARDADAIRKAKETLAANDDLTGAWLLALDQSVSPAELSRLLEDFPHILSLATREDRIQLYSRLANALAAVGNLEAAIRNYNSAIKLVEESRTQVKFIEAAPAFFSRYTDIYGDAIAALYSAHRARLKDPNSVTGGFFATYPAAALYLAEAAHSRQFADRYGPSLTEAFGTRAQLPKDLLEREKILWRNLNDYDSIILDPEHDPFASRQASEQAGLAYNEFLDSLNTNYPDFATLRFPRPISSDRLPEQLDGRFIVFYQVTKEAVYWWVLKDRTVVGFDRYQISRIALRHLVGGFRRFINDPAPADLQKALVTGPFTLIQSTTPSTGPPRVVIIPDDALYLLPWEALGGLDGGYLGDRFVISYAPSLTTLAQAVRAAPPPARGTALLVGNVQEQNATIPRVGTFPPLGREELNRVAAALRSAGYETDIWEGPNATRESLFQKNPTTYDVIHFDTHGFAETLDPLPSLLLHPSAASPLGLLVLSDIAQLRLRASLVTLSACETALGTETRKELDPLPGEGVQGLARMFLLAGSRSILASLWSAKPNGTAALMETFYKQMVVAKEHPDKATALFRAKVGLRKLGYKNDDLAPFILIGDPGD